eukprot:scaffold1038_cov122-Isochrysis_galbana.AAC.8
MIAVYLDPVPSLVSLPQTPPSPLPPHTPLIPTTSSPADDTDESPEIPIYGLTHPWPAHYRAHPLNPIATTDPEETQFPFSPLAGEPNSLNDQLQSGAVQASAAAAHYGVHPTAATDPDETQSPFSPPADDTDLESSQLEFESSALRLAAATATAAYLAAPIAPAPPAKAPSPTTAQATAAAATAASVAAPTRPPTARQCSVPPHRTSRRRRSSASPLDGCRCASGRARIGPHAAGKALTNQNRGRHRMVPSMARQGKRPRA